MRTVKLLPAVVTRVGALSRWPVRRVLLKQIYFSGYQSYALTLFIGAAVGGIVSAQLHHQIGESGEASLRLITTITLTELAPMLTGILLTARSASAMASELALMRVHGELATLDLLGLDPYAYLIMPRVLGMTVSATVLGFYFAVAAIFAGAIGVAGFGFVHAIASLPGAVPLVDLELCLFKSAVFGAAVAIEACGRGLAGGYSGTDVPIAASTAVIRALLALFVLDLVIILIRHYF